MTDKDKGELRRLLENVEEAAEAVSYGNWPENVRALQLCMAKLRAKVNDLTL